MYDIVGSIVVYKNPLEQLKQAVDSFFSTNLNVQLYIVDNSPDESARALCSDKRIVYVFNGRNLGFGAAHNIAIKSSVEQGAYHAILNPDVYFDPGVLDKLFEFAQRRPDVGLVMPKVLNPDGSVQYLCKRLPSPADLILRRFVPPVLQSLFKERLAHYEMRDQDYTKVLSVPVLSGCFMLISGSALSRVGIFDDRFFMYLEDVDLCRRIHQSFKTVYFPEATVYHRNGKGSYREVRLLVHHISSAFHYFQKWGWFSDPERDAINRGASASTALPRSVTEP
jgi:GT2 family glycosyltransferase